MLFFSLIFVNVKLETQFHHFAILMLCKQQTKETKKGRRSWENIVARHTQLSLRCLLSLTFQEFAFFSTALSVLFSVLHFRSFSFSDQLNFSCNFVWKQNQFYFFLIKNCANISQLESVTASVKQTHQEREKRREVWSWIAARRQNHVRKYILNIFSLRLHRDNEEDFEGKYLLGASWRKKKPVQAWET